MWTHLRRVVLASLLVQGCTRVNSQYADGERGETEFGTTARDPSGTQPSSPTNPSQPTTPSTQSTLEPTDASGDSTAEVGPGTSDDASETRADDSVGATTDVDPTDCSTYVQDCPSGQKCMPWASDGGTWDALDCFPLEPTSPGGPGDPCMVVGTAASGIDDCGETSMCWDVDPENGEGACVPFCIGSPRAPACDEPERACVRSNDDILALCLLQCDPLLQSCSDGFACLPAGDNGDSFVCVVDASGDDGEVGDPCEFTNACDPGNLCVDAEVLDECGAESCCTSYCDVGTGEICEAPLSCVPFYDDGMSPAGYESVGFCGID